jgi:tetratricopeptide (TPR) repeat protein
MKPRTKPQRKQPAPAKGQPSRRPTGLPRESRWERVKPGALLVALVLLAYAPLVQAGYIWDDDNYVTENAPLRSGHGLLRIWLDTSTEKQYYPLVHTTFWFEYHLWGLWPLGYHLVNVLLHATSAVLAWRVLTRLQLPGAWLAAALFAVHPVEAESVAWITERKNVLSMALALGSMLCYLRFAPVNAPSETARAGNRQWRWYALALTLFIGALLSKTVVASLPAVLLVIYWWKRSRITPNDVLPLVPFFAIGVSLGLLTVLLEKHNVRAVGAEWDFSLTDRLLIAGRALWFYASKVAWPNPLVFFYPRWDIDSHLWWQYMFPAAALATIAALWGTRRLLGRGPLAAVLIFAGVLVPALGFFNVFPFRYSFVADHFEYHASVALICLAASGAALAAARLPAHRHNAEAIAAGALLLVLGGLTFAQSFVYRDLETLYHHTIAKNPTGWTAYSNLGVYVEMMGRHDEAYDLFRKAYDLRPDEPKNPNNLGHIMLKLGERDGFKPGDLDEIERYFHEALKLEPRQGAAGRGLAFVLLYQNRYLESAQQFAQALQVRADDADALVGLGAVMKAEGKDNQAEECFRKAITINPHCSDAYRLLARLRVRQGRTSEAIRILDEAVHVLPSHADAHYDLANLLADERYARAADHFRMVVQLNPRHADAWHRLGRVYGDLGQYDQAIECFEKTLQLQPDLADAKTDLEKALELKAKQPATK